MPIRLLTTIFIATFFISKANAQKLLNYTYKDSTFIFTVSLDNRLVDTLNSGFKCQVKSISIINLQTGELIQTITDPYRFDSPTCDSVDLFWIGDFNFDASIDFGVLMGIHPSFYCSTLNVYSWWLFNNKTKQFERNLQLERIEPSEFDSKKKLIYVSCRDFHNIYKFMNRILTLVEEKRATYDMDKMIKTWTTRKLIKGKMKIVDRRIKKIEN